MYVHSTMLLSSLYRYGLVVILKSSGWWRCLWRSVWDSVMWWRLCSLSRQRLCTTHAGSSERGFRRLRQDKVGFVFLCWLLSVTFIQSNPQCIFPNKNRTLVIGVACNMLYQLSKRNLYNVDCFLFFYCFFKYLYIFPKNIQLQCELWNVIKHYKS